jgi:hypothetical protein
MKHLRTFVVVLAWGTALAACEQSPTSFDGGGTFGSGHRRSTTSAEGAAGSGDMVPQPTNDAATTSSTVVVADSVNSDGRGGGHGFGSGH